MYVAFFIKIATSQGFAFFGRRHVEWVKYWQMPSPKTSLFTTIWPAGVMMMILKNTMEHDKKMIIIRYDKRYGKRKNKKMLSPKTSLFTKIRLAN